MCDREKLNKCKCISLLLEKRLPNRTSVNMCCILYDVKGRGESYILGQYSIKVQSKEVTPLTNLPHGRCSIFDLQQQLHDLPFFLLLRAQRGLINLNLINTVSQTCLTSDRTNMLILQCFMLKKKFDTHQQFVKILDVIGFEEGEVS